MRGCHTCEAALEGSFIRMTDNIPEHFFSGKRNCLMRIPDWNPEWSETTWDQSLNRRLDELTFDVIVESPRSAAMNCALDEMLLYRVAEEKRAPVFWMCD